MCQKSLPIEKQALDPRTGPEIHHTKFNCKGFIIEHERESTSGSEGEGRGNQFIVDIDAFTPSPGGVVDGDAMALVFKVKPEPT
jgi:hypothetical protein